LPALVGVRRGEPCGLRWSDLDQERGDLLIARGVVAVPGRELLIRATKTHAVRRVALDAGTMTLLGEHYTQVEMTARAVGTALVGPREHKGSGRLRACRAAWDLAGAALPEGPPTVAVAADRARVSELAEVTAEQPVTT